MARAADDGVRPAEDPAAVITNVWTLTSQSAEQYAARNHFDLKLARTYVAIADARVRGYVTLTGGALRGVELPGDDALGFPGYPLPVVVLARLAVSADLQRGGVGQ